jgi:hypothetical protein
MQSTSAIMMLLVTAVGQAQEAPSQEPGKVDPEKANAAETTRLAKEELAKWEFHLGTDRRARPKMHVEPVLRWSNPVTGPVYGDVYVWTHQGRPQVVVSVHKFFTPRLKHMSTEFHSLALEGLTAFRSGQNVWHPPHAGIELKPIPSAPMPAGTTAQRLRQMRSLAGHFSASSIDAHDESWQLRLLPRPIYCYEGTNSDLLGGAVFAFVQGTNPEVWLVIEARRIGDRHEWQYALARFNAAVQLQVRHGRREVWSVPRIAPPWNVRDPREPYIGFRVR